MDTRELLLRRRGLVFVEPSGDQLAERYVDAAEILLADLGYAFSTRLRERLAQMPLADLTVLQAWLRSTLAAKVGANQSHRPLFRRFPDDVPSDTADLWFRKVLVHFLQTAEQPCLFCRRTGTTHVLSPCHHVVCDHCFDGRNYSACPVCERHVDRDAPFFEPSADHDRRPAEKVRFKLLDLGDDLDAQARASFSALCERKQALSPDDRTDLDVLVRTYGERVLAWLPASISVRENVALVFGTLLRLGDPGRVLPAAAKHLATATDVLRLIAAFSGADVSLQRQLVFKPRRVQDLSDRIRQQFARFYAPKQTVHVPARIHRFKVAPIRRPLRKALLSVLEAMRPDLLVEDMLRHRAYWVWIGEFLHPHEYRKRFPNVAHAFEIVRRQAPDGTAAPPFQGYYAKIEAATSRGDAAALTALLRERPGELARRFDHALRIAANDAQASTQLIAAFTAAVPRFSTPVLLTLLAVLPLRTRGAKLRVFWPKGPVATGVHRPDTRSPLPAALAQPAIDAIEAELLRRFAEKPAFRNMILDRALADIIVPFNERTASRSAIPLPRGSHLSLPAGKTMRLFLHWCQPEHDGEETDLDLSIGFYGADWTYRGVCSYYELTFADGSGATIATSSGDLRDAPFPDGATEFVDVDRERALEQGIRYAVMVVNSYAGMPFGRLHRSFAGIMLRDDPHGSHFDPRTVELKFDLQGAHGIFLPLVLDLRENRLHWLDVYSRGQLQFNNVASSNAAIKTICPQLIDYFASGARLSMYELALLHAAARGEKVYLRGSAPTLFEREPGEGPAAFLERLRDGAGGRTVAGLPAAFTDPVFAALYRDDVELPAASACYALLHEKTANTLAASDLIS